MSGWLDLNAWSAVPETAEEPQPAASTKLCPICRREFDAFFVRCPSDQVELTQSSLPVLQSKRFECVKKIGNGTLFEVYEGKHTSGESKVAVKVLRQEFPCEQRNMKNFEREQMVCAVLQHKNICRQLSFGALAEQYALRPYIVNEYLEGIDLASALEKWGKCETEIALKIIEQTSDAFAHAHAMGAVHGDIRPGNVYLTTDESEPVVKIVDFAGSKRIFCGTENEPGAKPNSASTEDALVTAPYTAPELAHATAPTTATDIYALGCLFYELLAGAPPFVADSIYELAFMHERDEPKPLKETKGVPEKLRSVIMRCLAKDPKDRPETPAEIRLALEADTSNRAK